MDRFYGFDLGDAESAVSRLDKNENDVPEILPVNEAKSFISAYALLKDGTLLIGEEACYLVGHESAEDGVACVLCGCGQYAEVDIFVDVVVLSDVGGE